MYDYTIIGSGPTGLTLALYLANLKKKVLIVEKENSIGGIHRVKRINGLFTEHGPRIYLDNYANFMKILKFLGTSFDQIFSKYDFQISTIGGKSISNFSIREIIIIMFNFININGINKKQSLLDFTTENNFSMKAVEYMDRLCRLTDGAGIDRYTTYEFIQIINQNALNSIYLPKLPNDIGLFKIWKKKLQNLGVSFLLNTKLVDLIPNQKIITTINLKNNNNQTIKIKSKNFILAIPPHALVKVLEKSKSKNAFGNIKTLSKWAHNARYLNYITVSLHWNKKLILPKVWGFPSNDWGIIFTVMTKNMNFTHKDSKTVMTVAISKHTMSSHIKKKPNQCNEIELKNEIFRQLKSSFPNLPKPTHQILSQNTYEHKTWHHNDHAFMLTKYGYLKSTGKYTNLYNCGTHNGNSEYAFTSLESAVTNAIKLIHTIEPKGKILYPIQQAKTLRDIIYKIMTLLCISAVIYKYFM